MNSSLHFLARRLAFLSALLFSFTSAAALAQQDDPPGRVAHLTQREGSVVFAPDGEDEWLELPANRPLTRGDRLWTDRGARAELHLGAATVHLDGESHLALFELDHEAAQLSLTQGSVNARVRELQPRENFEVDTPNLALRAQQPGDYRVDVDAERQVTRVTVRSGAARVYGERGESVQLAAGQQAVFAGRDLEQVRGFFGGMDDFGQWAAERNRLEDQSISARYLPREVIGYSQLDHHGNWGQHADYGAVWYPRVTVDDWAPYRYGRWTYVRPWGWTWVDDAPWGFAPFHYGRWAVIGGRWAWVPGHFGPRPVYAPALVAFVGGGSGVSFSLTIGSGPGIAWYPLAPGEAWYPTYRYSPVYLRNVNRNIVINHIHVHRHRSRVNAVTAVRVDDFHRGRPVRERWQRVRAEDLRGAPVLRELPRPERGREAERDRRERPRLQAAPPAAVPMVPGRVVRERREDRDTRDNRDARGRGRDADEARDGGRQRPPVQPQQVEQQREQRDAREQRDQAARQQQERAQREQERAGREQERQQREQERQQREQALQQQQQQRAAREQERAQREQAGRQQQERLEREQERAQREAQRQQREQAMQQQERQQREAQRQQREQAVQQQQQQQRAQREQERAEREQQRAQREQERAQREQARPRPMPSGRGNDDERRGNQRSQRGEEDERRGRGGRGG